MLRVNIGIIVTRVAYLSGFIIVVKNKEDGFCKRRANTYNPVSRRYECNNE